MNHKYTATKIGFILSVACVFVSFTIVIPFIFSVPVADGLEPILRQFVVVEKYATVGFLIIAILFALFLISMLLYLRVIRRQVGRGRPFSRSHLVLFYTFNLFIFHPLFFYLYSSISWNSSTEVQFVFGAYKTFPVSGAVFLVLGLFVDFVKNRMLKRHNDLSCKIQPPTLTPP